MRARDNPFRTDCVLKIRYRLEGITWDGLLRRCEALGYRGALVGPCGSGKTTLLEDLEPKLRERGFHPRMVRLNGDHARLKPSDWDFIPSRLTRRDILLIDGAEQLSALSWQRFQWITRSAGGLIITTHKSGRLPTLWECRTSAALLAEIAGVLLDAEPAGLTNEAQALFEKHCGNLREALREWYDWAVAGAVSSRLRISP